MLLRIVLDCGDGDDVNNERVAGDGGSYVSAVLLTLR